MTQSHIDPERSDTYWILDPEQIECLASPQRMMLIDRLASEGPMSPEDLAHGAELKPTAIYHHLKKLLAVGLVNIAGRQWQDGAKKPQTLYATPAPRMRLLRAFDDPANAPFLCKASGSLLRQAQRDFEAGLSADGSVADGPHRNLGFFRLVSRPDAATLAKVNDHLAAIADLLWASNDPEADPISLAWVISPMPAHPHEGDTE